MMPKKMVIIAGYFDGESYGLLGPQLAATVIREHTLYDCIVVAVTREDDKNDLKKALPAYFGTAPPVVGFSMLGGRDDLVALAGQMKADGAVTILAGPQAAADYAGEVDWREHPHRFAGYADQFSFALQGPAEQIVPYLDDPHGLTWQDRPGFVKQMPGATLLENPSRPWRENYLSRVDWNHIYRLERGTLVSLDITSGQVLQQIGCPHAAKSTWIDIDYPAALARSTRRSIRVQVKGCSFCDVAMDKGFSGTLGIEAVLAQIGRLPDGADGRKIPFELINENPLPDLNRLLQRCLSAGTAISRINLTMRADGLVRGEKHLREALQTARKMNARLILSAMGFESFDDRILHNLNKGVDTAANLAAVRLIRRFKNEFPETWGYLHQEGGNHGLIHPTPWDTDRTAATIQAIVSAHRLSADILPRHSTPLIVHHASRLGDWIRAIEDEENIRFERHGSIIAWWQIGDRFLL